MVLGHKEAAQVLLKNNASAQFEHVSGWNGKLFNTTFSLCSLWSSVEFIIYVFLVLHEATCRADPDLLRLALEYKDVQKQNKRSTLVPDLLRRLADVCFFNFE